MIIPMTRVRILGPRTELDRTLAALQDLGTVHLAAPKPAPALHPVALSDREARQARHLRNLARDLDALASRTNAAPNPVPTGAPASTADFARWARATHRVARTLDRLDRQARDVAAERAEIARFEHFVQAFRGLLPRARGGRMHGYQLILRGEDPDAVARLRAALEKVLGTDFALETSSMPSGELAALLLVPTNEAARVDRLLAQSGIHELPLPPGVSSAGILDAVPALEARRTALDAELAELERRRAGLAAEEGPDLARGRIAAADRLLELAAREQTATTPRSFVIEGWTPTSEQPRLARELGRRCGTAVVIETVAREEWSGADAPVVLANPRLFRPFELLTGMLPLPKYGSIDPTPYTAVFFPMFFGLILGDIGYGLVLAALALWLRRRSREGSPARSIAEVLGAGSAFAVLFGIGFGEFFGDLGHHWFGLSPVVFNREESLIPFLALAVAIGLVHVSLGLVLGIINAARGHPRQAVGRSAALVMLIFVAVALLAAFEVVPRALLTPAVVVTLIAFPVLVIAEGIIAPIEFLSTVSNVLSYARIMALGTASVMMAVVANRLAGSVGSVVVGVLFGLLFHLVNFVLGVFAPTVHGLRLHYVEFFGKFYSPGGAPFAPFGHWRPQPTPRP